MRRAALPLLLSLIVFLPATTPARAQVHKPDSKFPVTPTLFAEGLGGCEGLAFNGAGEMYVSCSKALWRVDPDATRTKIAELDSNLGVTAIGDRDLLVADFGPTNAFKQHRNADGIVWRITPAGKKTAVVTGIGDPNFVLVRKDGKLLISDDATNEIFLAGLDGTLELFTTAVNHPNGLALSADEATLYIAQIFESIRPVVADNAVWELKLKDSRPLRGAKLLVRTGPGAANDGLAMDELGRLYIAANGEGRIWRYDPSTEELVVICNGVFGAASMAFGQGKFDRHSLFITTTNAAGRGGKIWKVDAGVGGMPLNR